MMSPFARRYTQFVASNLDELKAAEAAEKENFAKYVEEIAGGEGEPGEGEPNPMAEKEMPEEYFQCSLTGNMTKLSFSTADDPFYKQSAARYYPEALVFNKHGELLSRVGPSNKSDGTALHYFDDFRDKKLKINDDKKV